MKRPENMRANRWQVAPPFPDSLRGKLDHIHPVLLQVLYNRGLVEPAQVQAFLENRYLQSTDPFLLPDMERAVERITQAVRNDEMIVVYGDFDADGVTATVLLTEALRGLGLKREQVQPYIPDRVDEGYGLNEEALSALKARGAGLVISVDCGVRSVREVAHAGAIGLDVIVTDHHSIGPTLPPAQAIVNPKRSDSRYPEQMLAGVGIAFKLAQALCLAFPERVAFEEDSLLDLVAIGTVADLAPLQGENRKLVVDGLRVLNEARRPGVAALAQVTRVKPGNILAESIGFGLGPRINAAGRLDHAYTAARLLAANNMVSASRFARRLDDLNRQRQRITRELSARAEEMIDPDAPILIASGGDFLAGVVGLVASRLADRNYRPAIIIEEGEGESRGSCRSIPEFHITEALDETADLLVRHGGHAQAAGFTLRNENLDTFVERMTRIADARLSGLDLRPTIAIDAEMSLDEIDWALQEWLNQLEPTGYANPTPIFVSRNVTVIDHRTVGHDGNHLQLRLSAGNGDGSQAQVFPAIAFRQGEWASQLPQVIDVVYTVNVNEWQGRRELQLIVQDMHPAAGQAASPAGG